MKKVLSILSLIILISACGDGITENTMIVSGSVKGLKKGTLYLQHIPDSTLSTIDSLQIKGDGGFHFQTELESPEIFYLYLKKEDNNDINDRITFFGEPGTIQINTSWNTFEANAEITGSASTEKLKEYRSQMTNINKRKLVLLQQSLNNDGSLNESQLDSLQKLNDRMTQRSYVYTINFALNNNDSYIAPYVLVNEIPNANVKYLDSVNNSLTPEVADSKYGKELSQLILNLKK